MVRRHDAASRIGGHLYLEDPDTPGTCVHCGLIERSGVHVNELPTVNRDVADLEARRIGERPDP